METQDELRLARALFQLSIYLEALRLPFALQELYCIAYGELWREMPGASWLHLLREDRYVTAGRNEFYTLKTIFATMHRAELGILLAVLEEETEKAGVGMGVLNPGHYRRRPKDDDRASTN